MRSTKVADSRAAAAGVGARERSRNLDVVRAAAALAVLLGHAYQLSGSFLPSTDRKPFHLIVNNGAAGVWFFFALSGYLIAGPFVRALLTGEDLPSIRGYSIRRTARIFPAYAVALLVVIALGLPRGVHPRWWQYPLHFTLLHNLWPGEEQAIMFASWTLTLEMLFYIAVPAVAVLVRRYRTRPIPPAAMAAGIVAVWAASIGWSIAAATVGNPTYGLWLRVLLPSMLSMFCPGILVSLAVAMVRQGSEPRLFAWLRTHRLTLVAAMVPLVVIGAVGSTIVARVPFELSRQAYALAAGLVVVLAVSLPEPSGSTGRVLGWFGFISYGIYLWQAAIVGIIEHHGVHGLVPMAHTGTGAYLVHAVYLMAVVLTAAWLSWVLIEQPMIRRARRWAAGPPPADAAIVVASAAG